MNNEEEKRCPLCAEEIDWTDQQLNPCKCGYEVCVWCWHHIMDMAEKDVTEGRCPACRTPYDKDRIVGVESNFQRVAANSSIVQVDFTDEQIWYAIFGTIIDGILVPLVTWARHLECCVPDLIMYHQLSTNAFYQCRNKDLKETLW
ncbi:hypothetical protein LXL04_029972 [Taraxacum kok-saghyz]